MKQKLQFLLAMLLMAATGTMTSFADTITPDQEILYRTNNDNNGWTKVYEANSTNQEFEMKYYAGFFALQKYTVPDLAEVKSITLNIAGDPSKGTDALAIWAFTSNDWTTSTAATTLAPIVTTIVGIAPHATAGDANTPLLNTCGSNRKTVDGVQYCHFEISGTALETLKAKAVGNTFTLMLTNRTDDLKTDTQRKYYSNGHENEAYRPYLSVVYNSPVKIGETGYETLNAAFDAVAEGATATINIYHDVTITSRCNTEQKTINVVPTKSGLTITSTLSNSIWLLNNTKGGTLTIGCDEYPLTIDGGNISNANNFIESSQNGSTTTLNNVTICNATSTHNFGIIANKTDGSLHLKNVTFDNCTANDGWGIVFAGSNNVFLEENLTFNNCTGYDIYLEKKFLRVGDISTTLTKPLKIFYQEPVLGAVVLSSANGGDKSNLFQLMNDNFGVVKKSDHFTDHVLTEAYTMSINTYGASTLILPYEATIPENVKAYTLNYTAGASTVVATEQFTTIPANTPVLLNADEGKYWFINKTHVAANTVGSGTHTVGALTGVYASTPVPAGSYILWANAENPIGFYKANNNTVGANRAYLTAEGAPARLSVSFDEVETTGIESAKQVFESDAIYNLQGVRIDRPTKGIYVKKGKKFFVK